MSPLARLRGCALFAALALCPAVRAAEAPPAASATASASEAAAKDPFRPKHFEVRDITGRALVWEPWSTGWRAIAKGDRLWQNSLIQVERRAVLRVAFDTLRGLDGKGMGDHVQITLDKPIVVRLDENALRQVNLSPFFASESSEKGQQEESKLLVFRSIAEAWERFAAMLAKQGFTVRLPASLDPEAKLALKPKKILIRTPTDGSTIYTERVPYEVRVAWNRVTDPNVTYELRLWRFDETRPEAQARTKQDYHFLNLRGEGLHFLQVTTSDGKWQSGLHRIFVAMPIGGRIQRAIPPNLVTNIMLRTPPRGFVYVASKLPAPVGFNWEAPGPLAPDQQFYLTVTDDKDRSLLRHELRGTTYSVRIAKPGTYRWTVQSSHVAASGELLFTTSETRTFTVESLSGFFAGNRDPFGELLLGKAPVTLYLEEGL